MDEPITDVVFVTDEKDTPEGYKVVSRLHTHAIFTCHLVCNGIYVKSHLEGELAS